jgi:SAM-dependent methyltransferase
MNEDFWDERYRSTSGLWSGEANSQLVTEAAELSPGRALDAGCGEGADAIWLGEHGWLVTAVDISTVALARGAAKAAEVGAAVADRLTWVHADLRTWAPDHDYDLVSAQFLHLPTEPRASLYRRLAASVAPGGNLLIVGHHPSDLRTTARRPPARELFFTATDVAELLDPNEWRIVVGAARPRPATDPEGQPVTVHDTVLRAERHL